MWSGDFKYEYCGWHSLLYSLYVFFFWLPISVSRGSRHTLNVAAVCCCVAIITLYKSPIQSCTESENEVSFELDVSKTSVRDLAACLTYVNFNDGRKHTSTMNFHLSNQGKAP